MFKEEIIEHKLNMLFDVLLDIKYQLGENEIKQRCEQKEFEIKERQEVLENLHNMQSNSWNYRQKLIDDFYKFSNNSNLGEVESDK